MGMGREMYFNCNVKTEEEVARKSFRSTCIENLFSSVA
jgi:hypothetical protein